MRILGEVLIALRGGPTRYEDADVDAVSAPSHENAVVIAKRPRRAARQGQDPTDDAARAGDEAPTQP